MKSREQKSHGRGRTASAVLLLTFGVLFGILLGPLTLILPGTQTVWAALLLFGKGIVLYALLVLLFTLITVLLIRLIRASRAETEALRALSRAAGEIAQGNFDVRVPATGRGELRTLTEEFTRMAEALSELDRAHAAFTASAVHDLRTPMMSVAGFADAILSGKIPKEKEREYLKTISAETKRLSRMVSDLLALERIRAGEQRFESRAFDLAEAARLVLISLEGQIDAKHLDVSFDVDGDRIPTLADPDAIHRVLYNLCDNAVKFSRDGGTLALSLRTDAKTVSFSVKNDGDGIAPEAISHVFDRFYTQKAGNPAGTGIGLFVSKAIVDAHGGRISAESVYGESATFTVVLPKDPLAAES